MTEHLPDEITYGFVADRVLLAVGDTTDDTDRFPDGVPAKGTVTFTPERDTHYTQQTPATVLQQPIECTIYQGDPDDGEGTEDPKRIGLLVDPAGHVGNVALVVGWYSVSYRLERGAAKRFRFQVRPEHTADEPLWLSSVAPLTPSPSERFVVNEKVYTETLAARDTTEQYRDKTLEYRNQAQTARTGAETAETNAGTHATASASSASTAADILAEMQHLEPAVIAYTPTAAEGVNFNAMLVTVFSLGALKVVSVTGGYKKDHGNTGHILDVRSEHRPRGTTMSWTRKNTLIRLRGNGAMEQNAPAVQSVWDYMDLTYVTDRT